ncbi:MAG: FAD-dependent urate hydroxylase [Solirubrobacteraceae bacterium]|jgi:cation diffusion facilitator CzcD-associated flavoprotein CzcO|nr:FAD-dependent urate hydroxylase [Solirubrobacteraceae bacterium]
MSPGPAARHQVVVVGAGPHGLASAAYLQAAGVDVAVFGRPLSFWREHMPAGMLLRSSAKASSIAHPGRRHMIEDWAREQGREVRYPFPIEDWIDYASWFQRALVPQVDPRSVTEVERRGEGFVTRLEDGEEVESGRVVVAAGIAPFAWYPEALRGLPETLVSHSVDHRDLAAVARGSVAVLGRGQSAVESAALLRERGADVELIGRSGVLWLGTVPDGGSVPVARSARLRGLGARAPIPYPPTEVGGRQTGWASAFPNAFRRMPAWAQDYATRYALRPAAAHWLVERMRDAEITTGVTVQSAEPVGDRLRLRLTDGSERTVDHLLLATGYRVDVAGYPFLGRDLLESVQRMGGQPVLRRGMEASVPGLHFVGAPAALSFGPVMRFVVGTWYCGPTVARGIAGGRQPLFARAY